MCTNGQREGVLVCLQDLERQDAEAQRRPELTVFFYNVLALMCVCRGACVLGGGGMTCVSVYLSAGWAGHALHYGCVPSVEHVHTHACMHPRVRTHMYAMHRRTTKGWCVTVAPAACACMHACMCVCVCARARARVRVYVMYVSGTSTRAGVRLLFLPQHRRSTRHRSDSMCRVRLPLLCPCVYV